MLTAISPIDGRYAEKTKELSEYFSEFALIKYRVFVEIQYFIALCQHPLPQLEGFDLDKVDLLNDQFENFNLTDALRMELHATPIRVSLIEPGPITTDFRRNAARAFARHIDWRASPHRAAYEATLMARLHATDGPPDRFELPPSAVTARLIEALESPRPKARYFVTKPTYIADLMRRLMPTPLLDGVLRGR